MTLRSFAPLALVACLAVTGCGTSSSDSSPSAQPTSTATTDRPITSASSPSVPTTVTTGSTGGAPDVTKPCTFVTADQVSGVLGQPVTLEDQGYQCRFNKDTGWLDVEVLNPELQNTKDTYDYAKEHGTPVSDVGDESYIFGATQLTKVGDVVIEVNGADFPDPVSNAMLTQLTRQIAAKVP